MSLATLKADLLAVETAVSAIAGIADVPTAIRAIAVVGNDAADLIDLFAGAPTMQASVGADSDKAECLACCDRIEAACAAKPVMASVGALWDGKILAAFLANLPALIDIIRKLIG